MNLNQLRNQKEDKMIFVWSFQILFSAESRLIWTWNQLFWKITLKHWLYRFSNNNEKPTALSLYLFYVQLFRIKFSKFPAQNFPAFSTFPLFTHLLQLRLKREFLKTDIAKWTKQTKVFDPRNFPRRSFCVVAACSFPLVVIVWNIIWRVFLLKLNSRSKSFWISNLPAINSSSTQKTSPFVWFSFSTPFFVHIQ